MRNTRQGFDQQLKLPRVKTKKYGTESIMYKAVQHYNKIPLRTQRLPTLYTFKWELKKFFAQTPI